MIKLNKNSQSSNRHGFTLVELLVVISIIGILAGIGLSTFTTAQTKARDGKRKTHIRQIKDSLEAYYNDNHQYPTSNLGAISVCGSTYDQDCIWGTDALQDDLAGGAVYMVQLPHDPADNQNYYYDRTSTNSYYLYARLENNQDRDIPKDASNDPMVYPSTSCTSTGDLCNYAVASTNLLLPSPTPAP